VWRFRFYLSHDKRALTKFLKSVVWSDKGEVSQAIGNLLPIWSEISLDDALELLGPSEDYREPRVKQFAVQQLARAEDDELVLYLLQLVQALKFDQSPSVSFDNHKTSSSSTVTSPIAQSQRFAVAPSQRVSVGSSSTVLGRENRSSFTPNVTETPPRRDSQIKPLSLEDFLIERSCANPAVLGYQFYWYLTVEASADGDKSMQVMYGRVLQKFYDKMREVSGPFELDCSETNWPSGIYDTLWGIFFGQIRRIEVGRWLRLFSDKNPL
jgi:phosphatidylinositol 3-kinase